MSEIFLQLGNVTVIDEQCDTCKLVDFTPGTCDPACSRKTQDVFRFQHPALPDTLHSVDRLAVARGDVDLGEWVRGKCRLIEQQAETIASYALKKVAAKGAR